MRADVPDRPNRNLGAGRVHGDAASISVGNGDHVVHLGKSRQNLVPDAAHRILHRGSHALHGGGDAENVLGSHAAIRIAVAVKGVPGQSRLRRRGRRSQRQFGQGRRWRQFDGVFVYPRTLGDGTGRQSNDLAVASDRVSGPQVLQRHLVRLRDALAQGQPVGKLCARRQAVGIDDDRNVVELMDPDVERFHVVLMLTTLTSIPRFVTEQFAGYVTTNAEGHLAMTPVGKRNFKLGHALHLRYAAKGAASTKSQRRACFRQPPQDLALGKGTASAVPPATQAPGLQRLRFQPP